MRIVPTHRIALLDGFTVRRLAERDEVLLADEMPYSVQRLVAHVSLARRATRTAVAGVLWPEVTEARAHGSLRSALWRLHRSAPGLVVTRGPVLALAEGVDVDVRELASWAHEAMDERADLDDVIGPAGRLGEELLPGWYEDWVVLERERLRQLRMHALEAMADRLLRAGRFADALEAALAAVRAEPLRESAHRTVVRAHLAEGNLGEALRAFDRFSQLVGDALGVAPTVEMTRLLGGMRGPRASSR